MHTNLKKMEADDWSFLGGPTLVRSPMKTVPPLNTGSVTQRPCKKYPLRKRRRRLSASQSNETAKLRAAQLFAENNLASTPKCKKNEQVVVPTAWDHRPRYTERKKRQREKRER